MPLDWSTIIVACIGAFGIVGAAWIQRQRKQEFREIKQTLGTQNGQGNVVEMLEFLKTWALNHEIRHVYEADPKNQRQ